MTHWGPSHHPAAATYTSAQESERLCFWLWLNGITQGLELLGTEQMSQAWQNTPRPWLWPLMDPKDLLGREKGRGKDKEEKRNGAEEEWRTIHIRENNSPLPSINLLKEQESRNNEGVAILLQRGDVQNTHPEHLLASSSQPLPKLLSWPGAHPGAKGSWLS